MIRGSIEPFELIRNKSPFEQLSSCWLPCGCTHPLIFGKMVFAAAAMAYHVEHLHSAQAVDDAINREGEGTRLAVVRFDDE